MSKVSVIVPCYNVEKYLAQCIESLIAQTLEDIEIVLVDDGSPDNSGKICDQYKEQDERIKVIHKINEGVGAARNDGFKEATGEYVIFVDSDDYLPSEALNSLYTKAVQSDADIVIGDVNRVFSNMEKMAHFYAEEFIVTDKAQIQELIKTVFYKTYCPWPYQGSAAFGYGGPCNKLVRKQLLDNNEIKFDVQVRGIYDDIIYSAYILAASKTVVYIPVNVYNYRILETSITHTYKSIMLEINQAIFTAWDVFLLKYNENEVFTPAFYANVLRRFDESLSKYFFSPQNPKGRNEVLKELKSVIRSVPYSEIVRYVDVEKLEKRHYVEYKLLKIGSARLIYVFYGLLRLLWKLRGK